MAGLINRCELSLPELDLADDSEYDAIWALVDSGSSVHVINVERIFPGATIDKPPHDAKGFKCANGGVVPHRGSAIVPFKTVNGLQTVCKWNNAPVSMPVLSTDELSDNGKSLLYNTEDGYVVHPSNKHTSRFLAANGVCFLKMLVPKKYTC